jgi:hypothetical protein
MGGGDITIYKHFQHGTVQHAIVAGRSDRAVHQHTGRRMEVGYNTSIILTPE